jgi:carboxypeptidase T
MSHLQRKILRKSKNRIVTLASAVLPSTTAAVVAITAVTVITLSSVLTNALPMKRVATIDAPLLLWIKARASNSAERSVIANTGASIEVVRDGYVVVLGDQKTRDKLSKLGVVESSFTVGRHFFDFPTEDASFHDYARTRQLLIDLHTKYPSITRLDSIGSSLEGRDMLRLRISGNLAQANSLPGVVFMGAHLAREHLSVEVPLMLAHTLLERYVSGDATIKRLVDSRDIHIIPLVNPDGAEYDIEGGSYHMWRKNRALVNGSPQGVDLNRNYGYQWGTGGSSTDPSDETYRGPSPFSEPETQHVRDFIDKQKNISSLLTFHTFSKLVLYPWGYSNSPIANSRDHAVFEKMAQTMAQWNGYTPEQASSLYIASGDTTDWAYGTHGIFAFTFELDPASEWDGGFYPGQAVIPQVFEKNLQPCLYMIEYADSPYRVLESTSEQFGLNNGMLR